MAERIFVPVILGPTAAGKTALAVRLAFENGWDIISCDSRQVYRHMDIGTAKPSAEDRRKVRHWLIDILDPSEPFSAFLFVQQAGAIIRDLARTGRTALVCGGTGLYASCLMRGISPQVESDPALRASLTRRAETEGVGALHRELAGRDPDSAASIHPNDLQRIVRALSVLEQTGRKSSDLVKLTLPPEDLCFAAAVIMPPREALYERINLRVDEMVRAGLWEEFLTLRRLGFDEHSPGMVTVGYRECFAVERGEIRMAEALETIKRNTRRFAKRQMTWLRTHGGLVITAAEYYTLNDFFASRKGCSP